MRYGCEPLGRKPLGPARQGKPQRFDAVVGGAPAAGRPTIFMELWTRLRNLRPHICVQSPLVAAVGLAASRDSNPQPGCSSSFELANRRRHLAHTRVALRHCRYSTGPCLATWYPASRRRCQVEMLLSGWPSHGPLPAIFRFGSVCCPAGENHPGSGRQQIFRRCQSAIRTVRPGSPGELAPTGWGPWLEPAIQT